MSEPREAFRDLERRIREASAYIDPVNRHRDAYLRDEITIEEMEARIAAELGIEQLASTMADVLKEDE